MTALPVQDAVPRVLLLCDRLDIAGGVERFVCTLATHLAGQGLRVAVGSVGTPRAALRYPLAAGVDVLHGGVPLPEGDGAWPLLRRQWRTGRVLAALARQRNPDVLLLNGLTTACAVLPWLPAALRARAICCDHNHFFARSRLWQWLRARWYPQVGAVVSLTQADAPRFCALNPCTEVIYNASPLTLAGDGAADGAQAADVHAALEPGPPAAAADTVLTVGRCVAQKGLDLLLAAWPWVLAARPGARLRIVGDGPLLASLQAQARAAGLAGSIDWLLPTPDIVAHYRAATLFVLPSRYEGMPLALLEAQALGLPAVAFDCPTGPAEIIGRDPETGLLVPPGDVGGLGEAIVALLADAPRRATMGRAAVERSRGVFGAQEHFRRWTALVRRVAAIPRSGWGAPTPEAGRG